MFLWAILGFLLIVTVLLDAFETVVLPRRVNRRFRLANMYYRLTWLIWSKRSKLFHSPQKKETYLSLYGPSSLIVLLALWALGLITGFALLHMGLQTQISLPEGKQINFGSLMYVSGTTLVTLGLGDIIPKSPLARFLFVMEAGTGFAFLAIVIGYIPILYQAFAKRETEVTLLDARAGSPPNALFLLTQYAGKDAPVAIDQLLASWELWAADLMETQLSYPVLSYYRSQHDNQSWIAALSLMLDVSTLILVGVDGVSKRQARLTYAMARHAATDLAQTLYLQPYAPKHDRLPENDLLYLRAHLQEAGLKLTEGADAEKQLKELREYYEPYVHTLSEYLSMPTISFIQKENTKEDWKSTAWENTKTIFLP